MNVKKRFGISIWSAFLSLGLLAGAPASAQSTFSPVVRVNDSAITVFEVRQRVRFFQLIKTLGDLDEQARTSLVNERLQMQAAQSLGLVATPEEIDAEMADFAGRGNLTIDQLRGVLGQAGIAFESFHDYSSARATWRKLISTRFAGRAQVTEDEIDRAMSLASGGGLRVLLSELILQVPQGQQDASMALARDLSRTLTSRTEFERAARRYSASPSRANGGRIDWVDLKNLSPQIASVIMGMSPGQVTPPLEMSGAIALFQLRALSEGQQARAQDAALDYAVLRLPHDRNGPNTKLIASITARADTCNDLYGLAADLPPQNLQRETRAPAAVPPAFLAALDQLDPGEISHALASERASETILVMLCGRSATIVTQENRVAVANRLRGQRMESLAASYLAELRAAAVIEEL